MGLLRSETMKQGVLVLPPQDARRYIELIGKDLNLQFEDMNAKDMRRPYRKHIQRIEEMERILRYITNEISAVTGYSITKNRTQEFLDATDSSLKLDPLEAELAAQYKQLTSFKEHNTTLLTERHVAAEELQVVNRATELHQVSSGGAGINAPLMEDSRISAIAGVLPVLDEYRLRMAIFRASRGNAFVDFFPCDTPVTDPKTGAEVYKAVFVVYFQAQGGASGPLHQKVSKVCHAVGVNVYAWPTDRQSALQRQKLLTIAVQEKDHALVGYREFMQAEMEQLTAPMHPGRNSRIEDWRIFCVQEKSIYTVLNMCHDSMMLRIGVWYPAADEERIDKKLNEWHKTGSERAMLMKSKKLSHSPPTYIKTNEYTEPFQDVINTYGIPRYQEANPALFAVVTFPFIFGMMYGDVGHGSMVLMAGLYVVFNAEKFRYTVPQLYSARYMLVSLGFFATYAGFLYNDFFSIGFELFPSRFHKPTVAEPGQAIEYQMNPNFNSRNSLVGGCDVPPCLGPYPFGLDSAWIDSSNELLFVNSLKMKLSVLMGVLQMVVGVLLRWSNACFERNLIDFCFECLPMMVFMLCFFGWMDFMVLYKWVNPIARPPSIINSMICMAMWPLGQEDHDPIFTGAFELAMNLFLVVVATVPVMLFPKPLFLLYKHKSEQKQKAASGYVELEDEEAGAGGHGHGDHGEFEFGEVFIHQIIETIEYVLGTVSHTASYLRIWALSLAHQQLSLVFFQKTLQMGLVMKLPWYWSGLVLYCMFAAWFVVTLAVLLGMDVLECFLHTLRLHWVEFQSKFYKADGYIFEPYGIKTIIVLSSED